jgi:hypothetical protein
VPYLKIPLDFTSKKKCRELSRSIGAPLAAAMLLRLYLLAGNESPHDGGLDMEPSEIEARICWRGRQGKALEVLQVTGCLVKTEKGYRIADWEEEQGHLLKFHLRAKKAAKSLWKGGTVDATSIA